MDKNPAYLVAIETLKSEETITKDTELRQSKYLNNVIEQDHRSSTL
ncbi:DDE-type integrase/transposase/recombinase [Leptolyngbya sp. FACHB-261]|nr:DDE-type integrase/transposase/recombinase [Leptolyngbya sp. FACHB-261]